MFDWITGLVGQTGYLGIALLMLAENVFLPVPSELIMPLAGFTAARGELNMAGVIVAGSVGSLAGARWADRHGRWLTLRPEEVDEAAAWFNRHCGKAVFIGRLIPALRTMISVPAGIAGMGLTKFLVYSALGTALWTALLAAAGYLLEAQYQKVGEYLNPVSNVVIGLIVLGYLYRVVTFPSRRTH